MTDLAMRLDAAVSGFAGRVGYALTNLTTGERVLARADDLFPTASVVKLPILTAFHAFVEAGEASWEETREITDADIPGGSGILQHLSFPRAISFRDAAWLMICHSDNLATNLLLKTMTIDGTNDLLRRVIGDNIRVDTYAGFQPDVPVQSMGQATPRALVRYLEDLAADRLPGATHTLDVARMQFYHSMIPRYLPFQAYGHSPVRLANKTGALPGIRADIGLLETRRAQAAMVFMTADSTDTGFTFANEGEECIGTLAKIAYDAWMDGDEQ